MKLSDMLFANALMGEGGGGGGGGSSDFPTITAVWHDDTETCTYSCDWSYSELWDKIGEYESFSYGCILNEVGYGSNGGTAGRRSPGGLGYIYIEFIGGEKLRYDQDGVISQVTSG